MEFDARILNLSESGIALLTGCALQPYSLVRCNIVVSDVPVAIPTLLQVRWSTVRRGSKSLSHLSGLHFVA